MAIEDQNSDSIASRIDQNLFTTTTQRSDDDTATHPNITALSLLIHHHGIFIGHITSTVLNKAAMNAISLSQFWEECLAYDEAHSPDSKLYKIDKYLEGEEFSLDYQNKLHSAEWLLYVDEAYVEPDFRGQRLSIWALEQLIGTMEADLGRKGVVMLQAGVSNKYPCSGLEDGGEKLGRHWRRMGFEVWSESNEDWLCLWCAERRKLNGLEGRLARAESKLEMS